MNYKKAGFYLYAPVIYFKSIPFFLLHGHPTMKCQGTVLQISPAFLILVSCFWENLFFLLGNIKVVVKHLQKNQIPGM